VKMGEGRPILVAIVDDHLIVSGGLEDRLRADGFEVLPPVTAVENLGSVGDVVVCDMHLPGRRGANAVRYLIERGARVLATSGVALDEEVLDAIAAGACGYVEKTASWPAYAGAIRAVAAGSHHLSAELARFLLDDVQRRRLDKDELGRLEQDVLRCFADGVRPGSIGVESLGRALGRIWEACARRRERYQPTPRERALMELAAAGMRHDEIAERMGISPQTVPGMLKSIKSKYLKVHPDAPGDVHPLTAAARWAWELGAGRRPGRAR
jgi:DNA-binding NarL/FixJ family response regulator